MTFYESQRWHSGEKRGFRLNVRRVAAAAAFASAEHFQSENALNQKFAVYKDKDTAGNENLILFLTGAILSQVIKSFFDRVKYV
ncbi:hypothetical protein [Desulfovibrio sp. ZJ200]|uniref:hypothetical protein n=1 Tax=Desulfovibrio sp. ZJ200 TaxID=2709792 RepID=UPI0013E9A4F3|nr:hypothetical protein [Desulfovibrio sp. ZJ200]